MRVPLLDLKPQFAPLREEIMSAIAEVCDSQYFINGPRVEAFEKEVSDYAGSAFATGCSSGSDALLLSLMAEDIQPGDEIITTPFTFFATVGCMARVKAKPVFVDIDPVSFNIDPARIEAAITPRTKMIMPVHLFGQMADMDPIMEIARKYNLVVVEDAAQAIGSEYKGRSAGSIGDYGCFSFFPSKNLGGFGDGGMVITSDEQKQAQLKCLRNHGDGPKYFHKYVGGNFRLDALQAAVLSIKLRHLNDWHAGRAENAALYRKLFAESKLTENEILLPEVKEDTTRHIYNQFCVRFPNADRNEVRQQMLDAGVGCEVYYPQPMHLQECFAELGYKEGDFPVTEAISKDIMAVPIYPELDDSQQQYVVESLEKILLG